MTHVSIIARMDEESELGEHKAVDEHALRGDVHEKPALGQKTLFEPLARLMSFDIQQ